MKWWHNPIRRSGCPFVPLLVMLASGTLFKRYLSGSLMIKGVFPKYLCNEQIFHEEILSFSDLTTSDDACLKPNIIVCVCAKLLQSCLTPGNLMGFSCCWAWAFSSCNEWVLLSSCGTQASHCGGFSCAEHAPWGLGSGVMAHRLSCPVACGISPGQGPNPCPLHGQADSSPLSHQGSPDLLSLSMDLPILDISYKWKCTICGLLHRASFT